MTNLRRAFLKLFGAASIALMVGTEHFYRPLKWSATPEPISSGNGIMASLKAWNVARQDGPVVWAHAKSGYVPTHIGCDSRRCRCGEQKWMADVHRRWNSGSFALSTHTCEVCRGWLR